MQICSSRQESIFSGLGLGFGSGVDTLAADTLKARLETEGAIAAPDSPAAFGALIASELARWKPVVERSNKKPE